MVQPAVTPVTPKELAAVIQAEPPGIPALLRAAGNQRVSAFEPTLTSVGRLRFSVTSKNKNCNIISDRYDL